MLNLRCKFGMPLTFDTDISSSSRYDGVLWRGTPQAPLKAPKTSRSLMKHSLKLQCLLLPRLGVGVALGNGVEEALAVAVGVGEGVGIGVSVGAGVGVGGGSPLTRGCG